MFAVRSHKVVVRSITALVVLSRTVVVRRIVICSMDWFVETLQ